ncbi:MAG: hypothetical protein JSW23_08380 [Planctomycetota bacterium]|nr:MAG: hypothetical protein JSW23_08380 [Planctomycetota bacterium]
MTCKKAFSKIPNLIALTVMGLAVFLSLKDNTCQAGEDISEADILFDTGKISHRFDGFGAQIVGRDRKGGELRRVLRELNIKYIRMESSRRGGKWEDIEKIRKLTDSLGIKWICMTWRGPRKWEDSKGNLKSEHVGDFAQWWLEEVTEFSKHGIRPEYIELMNEPDSDGQWSKGISPENYSNLVKATRAALDKADFADVGIAGPGATHLNWAHHSRDWIDALDSDAVEALAAWSTHS